MVTPECNSFLPHAPEDLVLATEYIVIREDRVERVCPGKQAAQACKESILPCGGWRFKLHKKCLCLGSFCGPEPAKPNPGYGCGIGLVKRGAADKDQPADKRG